MFTRTNIRIELDTKIDLSDATALKIRWRNPRGHTGQWDAFQDDQKMYYYTTRDDITIPGSWHFQAIVETGNNVNKGKIVSQTFNEPITLIP